MESAFTYNPGSTQIYSFSKDSFVLLVPDESKEEVSADEVHDAEDADVDEGPAVDVRSEEDWPGEVGEEEGGRVEDDD